MTGRIAWLEWHYQARSVAALLALAVSLGLGFLLTANAGEFQSFAPGGMVLANSPHALVENLIKIGLLAVFAMPAIIGGAVLRDLESGMSPLIYSTPVSTWQFLLGRFAGSFGVLAVVAAGAPVGFLLGTFWPWADPSLLGPTRLHHYGFGYIVIMLPTLLFTAALVFAVAVIARRMIYVYLMVMALLALSLIGGEANLIHPVVDPFLYEVFERQTRYLSAAERNQQLVKIDTLMLLSRALWGTLALAALALAWRRFSFSPVMRGEKPPAEMKGESHQFNSLSADWKISPLWESATSWRQLRVLMVWEIRQVLMSRPFLILLAISFTLLVLSLVSREVHYGVQALPVTRLMIGSLSSLILALMVVLAFYSSEIIWRERRCGFNGVLDAMPVPSVVVISSKISALLVVMAMIVGLGVVIAVGVQIGSGYYHFEPLLYLERGLFFNTLPYLCLAVLTCFFQVLGSHRFVGLLMFAVFMAALVGSRDLFGVEHPLLSFGLPAVPAPMSDMSGAREFMALGYWVRAYWFCLAGLFLMATVALWQRGILQPLRLRLRRLTRQTSVLPMVSAALLALGAVGVGAVIYHNTNIVNRYVTNADAEVMQVNYERNYQRFSSLPMPSITAVTMAVDLYPLQRRVTVAGEHLLRNRHEQPLTRIDVVFPPDLDLVSVTLDVAAAQSQASELATYVTFELDQPMLPEQQITLQFEAQLQHVGFAHDAPDTALVRNGIFIGNERFSPHIGYNPDYVLDDVRDRQHYGLAPLARRPLLEDTRQHNVNPTRADSTFIDFESTVSTIAGQTAITSGNLIERWEEGERAYFHYKMSGPIRNLYAYSSAHYDVVRDQVNGWDLEVFHHPGHDKNVGRMLDAAKDSLAYFSEVFSPYQYQKLTIAEFPAYRAFAQSFPDTIFFSEDLGFLDQIGPQDLDMPYYITAHEVAHQWWGHQLTAANTQGDGFLHETLAQYSAMLVMRNRYGRDTVRRFLKFELDRYLSARANDPQGELPLYRVEKQKYIHYRKGSIVMYALATYLGEGVVNRSLAQLLRLRAFSASPYAISTDFLKILKAQAKPEQHGLIEDMLENITLFDLQLHRADVRAAEHGGFRVTAHVDVAKFYANGEGEETEAPLDMAVDIGLFRRSPDAADFTEDDLIALKPVDLTSGSSTVEIVVSEQPAVVVIDPYYKLIDRQMGDNEVAVTTSN
ncbi:MAG: ABC transporter permease/M1 family aminopeptidase [Lysobacterales bacterium]